MDSHLTDEINRLCHKLDIVYISQSERKELEEKIIQLKDKRDKIRKVFYNDTEQ